ncbi:hypothetical protein MMC11_005700 [Xylographa trunciseda]|nr:hypothetical protein [Xylographa trunciseda]
MSQRQRPAKGHSIEYVLVLYGIPIKVTTESWQPVKDLYRKLLRMQPDEMQVDPGAVNIHPPSGGHQFPSASCSFRQEKVCKKLFKWLAGNFWHGSQLTAWLYVYEHEEGKLLSNNGVTSFCQPIDLETISPIKESFLLRVPVIAPSVTPPIANMLDYHNQRGRYSGNSLTIPHSYNSSSVIYVAPTSPAMPSAYDSNSSTRAYGQIPGPLTLTALSGQSMGTQQSLQQYAYQMSRNHRPSQNGPVWSPYVLSPASSMVYTTPSIATATTHAGYSTAPATAYPVAYGMSSPTATITSYPGYHANPDGTLVNTTQGAVSVDESRAVLVRNINHRADLEDIKAHFSRAGVIQHCDIGISRKDRRKCTAKIVFSDAQAAKAAAHRFNGTEFFGRLISTEVAKDDSPAERNRTVSEASLTELVPISPRARGGSGPLIVDGSEEDPIYEAAQPQASKKKGKSKETDQESVAKSVGMLRLGE